MPGFGPFAAAPIAAPPPSQTVAGSLVVCIAGLSSDSTVSTLTHPSEEIFFTEYQVGNNVRAHIGAIIVDDWASGAVDLAAFDTPGGAGTDDGAGVICVVLAPNP